MSKERIFADRDFDNMLYAVHKVPDGEAVYPKFPGMHALPSFTKYRSNTLEKNKVIKYVVFCYDRQSPIFEKFKTDDVKRKTISASYAGFVHDPETGLFAPEVDNMLRCGNKDVNLMIIDYVRQYNDPEYSVLVAGYELLYQKLNSLSAAVIKQVVTDDSDLSDQLKNEKLKGDLYNQAETLSQRLSELSNKITTDNNKLLNENLYSMIDQSIKNKLNISPESMAGIA